MTDDILVPEERGTFAVEARRAVYDVIALRRDIRHFLPDKDVEEPTLARILAAAHLAPSVGFSQPWGFVVLRDRDKRRRIRESFLQCRQAEAARFSPERRDKYLAHKLEGILEAPLNVCVVVDLRDKGDAILGTTAQPEAVRASACCAVQNLWLAARAEGVGVGWVSIVEPAVLRSELGLPAGVEPIAYLCVGYPVAFRARPMLEETRWRERRPVVDVVHLERWPHEAARADVRAPEGPDSGIPPFDERCRQAALAHQARLTKPTGSLGRLEGLAAWFAGARGRFPVPLPELAGLALFAADHGVAEEGVSAYGSQNTAAMVSNVMAGGAAINALCRQKSVRILLVDVGVAGDLSAVPVQPVVPLLARKVRAGTVNLRRGPAMSRNDAERALAVGFEVARDAVAGGVTLLGVGEIGIANTTAAAALVCAFTGTKPADVVGRGTGIDDQTLAHKSRVIAEALELHRPDPNAPLDVLSAVGGFELCAMVGCALQAARMRVPVVLDGFLSGAAALAACAIDPAVRPYLLASHVSAERGARLVLERLGLEPVLDLGLRLGEGTGAVLAMDLVRSAVDIQLSMATFATAGVVRRAGTTG